MHFVNTVYEITKYNCFVIFLNVLQMLTKSLLIYVEELFLIHDYRNKDC